MQYEVQAWKVTKFTARNEQLIVLFPQQDNMIAYKLNVHR